MNWKEIKEKYPKAIKRFMEWRMKNNAFNFLEKRFCVTQYGFAIESLQRKLGFQGKDIESWICYDRHSDDEGIRFLYNFFDEQNIYISINVNMFMMFDWSIITTPNISISIQSDFDYNLRIEAEEQAFLKAFEILEDKL